MTSSLELLFLFELSIANKSFDMDWNWLLTISSQDDDVVETAGSMATSLLMNIPDMSVFGLFVTRTGCLGFGSFTITGLSAGTLMQLKSIGGNKLLVVAVMTDWVGMIGAASLNKPLIFKTSPPFRTSLTMSLVTKASPV